MDLRGRLLDVPTVKQRLCRGVSGYDAHGRHGFGGAAVDRVAERHHCCRREGPQLPVLRHVRGGRALHDARRRDRHEARARAGFRHRRALQRVRRHGLQRGAGRAPEGAKYRELRKEVFSLYPLRLHKKTSPMPVHTANIKINLCTFLHPAMFFYSGSVILEKTKDEAFEITYVLDEPVREDIYEYITGE